MERCAENEPMTEPEGGSEPSASVLHALFMYLPFISFVRHYLGSRTV